MAFVRIERKNEIGERNGFVYIRYSDSKKKVVQKFSYVAVVSKSKKRLLCVTIINAIIPEIRFPEILTLNK